MKVRVFAISSLILAVSACGSDRRTQTFADADVPPCGVTAIGNHPFDVEASGVDCKAGAGVVRRWRSLRHVPQGWRCAELRCWSGETFETSASSVVLRRHVTGLPAAISLDGVAGVIPGMRSLVVEKRWRVVLSLEQLGSGCAAALVPNPMLSYPMQAFALFDHGRFAAVFFSSGARTAEGIQPLSTLRELRRAYGARLKERPPTFARRNGRRRAGPLSSRPAAARYYYVSRSSEPRWQLQFEVTRGVVTQIGFGGSGLSFVAGCPDQS
jgi:hypothetical protein